jgi:hypothetical protein
VPGQPHNEQKAISRTVATKRTDLFGVAGAVDDDKAAGVGRFTRLARFAKTGALLEERDEFYVGSYPELAK